MFSFGGRNVWTHTPAFKARWMRLHAWSELGVAVHNQKRLLASPTTPELLKRVVSVHFKYFFRCALRPWAPLLGGCRKEFCHRCLLLREALRRRTRRRNAPHWFPSRGFSDATLFSPRRSRPATTRTRRGPARQMAAAERTLQPIATQNALT